ncbi:transcriptional regulator GcvA [Gallaecimonas xiamenensis]|uniref:Glycine cleavage system transcriptional activator n=1 Tax=Gallaecimonas xiamenensis 3-C-1 TaxID=745411 RepID=K2J6P7_9GAMM|nr:transcriptional regulator GcvA [Gallaecimonas xiamenensis]EKE70602.1 DNA-binding transcriptional activator GcvA [Gallaecimonas xiamenensis 3-C-1]
MARQLPPLNALKAFEAAARHLSFTRAAEELFVTQAAISHQIKTLEDHLGLKLFRRRNRSLLLTEEGQSYYLDIKDIFSNLAEATARVLARSAKGTLTVAMQPSYAIQWMVPRLARFAEAHPDIDVRIKATETEEGGLTDDVDIAIYYGRGYWPGLRADRLQTEYLIPVCSPVLLSGPKPLEKPEDLAQHTLLHDGSRKAWQSWVKHLGLSHLIKVNQGPIFSHSAMVLQAAMYGQGIALAHSVLAEPDITAGRLVSPFKEVLRSPNAYFLVCQQSQAEQGKIVAFRDWILSLVKAEEERLLPEDVHVAG